MMYKNKQSKIIIILDDTTYNTQCDVDGTQKQNEYLISCLNLAGLSSQSCYIINYKKNYLELVEELSSCTGNVIVGFGANILKAFTQEKHISKWRGSILSIKIKDRYVKFIPTYSISDIIPDFKLRYIISLDLKKAKQQSEFPELRLPQRTLLTKPSKEEALMFIQKCSQNPLCGYDIETANNNIICIGLSYDPSIGMSIPTTLEYWNKTDLLDILKTLNTLLSNETTVKIGHNVSFDNLMLLRCFRIIVKNYQDTMLMHHVCYSEFPKSLAFCTSIYTDEPYYKDELKEWRASNIDANLWTYNAKDACVTLEIYHKLKEQLTLVDNWDAYNDLLLLQEPILYMTASGFNVDMKAIEEHKKYFQEELDKAEALFKEKHGNINPYSPKQLLELAKKNGISIPTKQGRETLDKDAIHKISKKHTIFDEVLAIRTNKKLIATYLSSELDGVDNRIRFSLNSAGTETGRLSSSKSIFGYGFNFQNVPKQIRNIIIPDEGMVFSEVDLVGAEAMVVAYESNDYALIRLFENGGNIHKYTARLIWNCDDEYIDNDKKLKEEKGLHTQSLYYKAKKVRHSGNYKGTWVTLSNQLDISAAEAKKLLHKFYANSPNLTLWHSIVLKKLSSDRTITTPFKRKRIFFNRLNEGMLREALAFIAQETVVRVLNKGTINFYYDTCYKHKDISIKLPVHDSMLIQHPPEKTEFVHDEIRKHFSVPIKSSYGLIYTIKLEIKTGPNWRDLE